jgi:hypothetical protein
MARAFKDAGDDPDPVPDDREIRIPAAGTWLGLGAGILIVLAVFAWTTM